MTPKEAVAVRWILAGASEKDAAHRLGIHKRTLHGRIERLYRRLNIKSRVELAALVFHAASIS